MMQTSFLGVVDCFDQSLVAGQHFLRPVFPELECAAEVTNATAGLDGTLERRRAGVRDDCAPKVYDELLRLNALDDKLVDLARTEVARRFRLVKTEPTRP
jgi:hypothetical protein